MTVADQLAIYSNTQSTLAALNAAVNATQAAIKKRRTELNGMTENASVANPIDLTDQYIKNPRFDNNDVTTGWSGTKFGTVSPKENAEHFEKTYDTYQTITGLPAGIYAVGVKAFYRAGNPGESLKNYVEGNPASKYAKLYVKTGDQKKEVSIVAPYVSNRTTEIGFADNGESLVSFQDAKGNEIVMMNREIIR